jgi:DNA-binding MarR family transcriptional regulator
VSTSPPPCAPERSQAGGVTTPELDVLVSAARTLVAITAHSINGQNSLDLSQLRALVIVASLGSASLGEVAEAGRMQLSTASRLCDRLVSLGLLHRAEDPTNRRQLALTLTAGGQDVVERARQERRKSLRALLQKVHPSRRAPLVALLQELVDAGGEPAEADLWALAWTP